MTQLKAYKGYDSVVSIDTSAGVLSGRITGIKDVVHFEASSVPELEAAFHEALDDYLEWCQELGVQPDKPYSGNVLVRMPPELHKALARRALRDHSSINAIAVSAIDEHLQDTATLAT